MAELDEVLTAIEKCLGTPLKRNKIKEKEMLERVNEFTAKNVRVIAPDYMSCYRRFTI